MTRTVDRFWLGNAVYARLADLIQDELGRNGTAAPDQTLINAVDEAEALLRVQRALAEGKTQIRLSAVERKR